MVVLTDLCVMEPTGPAGRLQVTSLHPGVTLDDVVEATTGFAIDAAPNIQKTIAPTAEELRILRTEADPLGIRRLEMTAAKKRGAMLDHVLTVEAEVMRRLLPAIAPGKSSLGL
jgi:glutaconate CoA-transferase, subunit B